MTDWKECEWKTLAPNPDAIPEFRAEELTKTTKFSVPDQHSNQTPVKFKSRALSLQIVL
jgi:hypothetical protein